ncbi:putative ABC transporter permease protein [Streptococcus pneumoniae]|nr:putative ABC transporter permease protein [Streptococcus pneumoniae]
MAELDGGVIEAAQASGATFWDIVGVYLSEGLPDLIRVTTVTLTILATIIIILIIFAIQFLGDFLTKKLSHK